MTPRTSAVLALVADSCHEPDAVLLAVVGYDVGHGLRLERAGTEIGGRAPEQWPGHRGAGTSASSNGRAVRVYTLKTMLHESKKSSSKFSES